MRQTVLKPSQDIYVNTQNKTNLYLQRILRIPENGVVNTAARNADHVDEETKYIK